LFFSLKAVSGKRYTVETKRVSVPIKKDQLTTGVTKAANNPATGNNSATGNNYATGNSSAAGNEPIVANESEVGNEPIVAKVSTHDGSLLAVDERQTTPPKGHAQGLHPMPKTHVAPQRKTRGRLP
jgi:hypothetical protein